MCRHGGIYGTKKSCVGMEVFIAALKNKSCAGMEVFMAALKNISCTCMEVFMATSKNHVQAWRYLWQHCQGAVHMQVSLQGDFS